MLRGNEQNITLARYIYICPIVDPSKSWTMDLLNPDPVKLTPQPNGPLHKVKVFMSPDHSIQPLVEFIKSAKTSLDAYIPGK